MTMPIFTDVLLRRDGSNLEEKGNLSIGLDSIQWDGDGGPFKINHVQFVSMDRPSGLNSGDWVKVEYGDQPQPSVAYFKEKGYPGGVDRIYSAMQHFPNSGQFECRVWTYRYHYRPAPRKPGWFGRARKGFVAATRANTLTLSVRKQKKREVALSEISGYTREALGAKRQWLTKMLELLIVGAGVGLILVVGLLLLPRGDGELLLVDILTNLFYAFIVGLGLVFIVGFILMIPDLLRIRSVDVFILRLKNGRPWEFGVHPQQSEAVARSLEAWGLARG